MSNKQQRIQNASDLSHDLFEQMTNISKAHGYDILAKHVGELKAENEQLKEQVKELLTTLEKIKMWEMPESRIYLDKEKTKQLSYGAAYGSNGERDYIKSLAVKAINKVAAK